MTGVLGRASIPQCSRRLLARRLSGRKAYFAIWVVSPSATRCTSRKRFPLTRGLVRALTIASMPSYAYILRCSDGHYYYGSTNDLRQRLQQHRDGLVPSTRWRLPAKLVYFEQYQTLAQARRRERGFKNGRTRRKTIDLRIAGFLPERLAPFA